ncbi:hypothetical protein DL96DRAFT_1607891 [Flagelloscypha sp. PMI_526]|nr:hypothetical protein DL96DRAFT_1607891 [Flagelloscypha sp. PMI_526]
MSSLLPTDLYVETFQYLRGEHLKSCSLVCSEFLRLARHRLTWHFSLHDPKKFAAFKRNISLRKKMKELCLNARSLYLSEGATDPDLHQWFPNIHHLSLDFLEDEEPLWSMPPFTQVYSLSLTRISGIPLGKLFVTFPSLKKLKLHQVSFDKSTLAASYEVAPELRYLSTDDVDDLRGTAPLAKYLEYKGRSIRSFRLRCNWSGNDPATNYFVPSLKPFLRYIFINEKFCHFIITTVDASFCIPLADLPQLRMLTFETVPPCPDWRWKKWASWHALQLQHQAPACFRKIQFLSHIWRRSTKPIEDGSEASYHDYEVNTLAESSQITLDFRLRTHCTGDVDKDTQLKMEYESEVEFLQNSLAVWHRENVRL